MPITNGSVVIPVEYSTQILRGVLGRSKALELGYRLPNMRGNTMVLNVLNYLPVADWVANSTTPVGAPEEIKEKPVSQLAWQGKEVVAKEIAVIVPVAINTLRDLQGNAIQLVPELTEQVVGAFNQVIDSAVFFGYRAPYQNYNGIVSEATAAGATVSWNGNGGTAFYDAINEAMTYVENSGYYPDAILGAPSLNGAFRNITNLGILPTDQGEIGALPRHIDLTGGFNTSSAFAIVGDFKRGLVYSVREEMEMRVLYEATIKDGATEYNLAQQDMVAFRFTMRLGFAIANPVNRVSGTLSSDGKYIEKGANAYPFAVITKTNASA